MQSSPCLWSHARNDCTGKDNSAFDGQEGDDKSRKDKSALEGHEGDDADY